jgi:hypothetical protein
MSAGNLMGLPDRSRSFLATIVGWVIVAVIVWLALGFLLGALRVLVRGVLFVALLVGLLWAYLALKAPSD